MVRESDAKERSSSEKPLEKHVSNTTPSDDEKKAEPITTREDGKIELKEEDNYEHLGFSYPTYKKWAILTVIFWVQMSMNFNTSVYP